MSISLYDVLDVAPDATSDEIRGAWRAAVADLDPTDRRFGVYNEAARTLLDPEARAAHDAELAADQEAPAAATPDAGASTEPVAEPNPKPGPKRAKPTPRPGRGSRPATGRAAPSSRGSGRRTPRRVPVWLHAALAAVLVALVAGVVLQLRQPSDAEVADATREAQTTAERAVSAVAAYDYRDLDEGRKRAEDYLTGDYAQEYEKNFDAVADEVERNEAVVRADVIGSAVTRVDTDDLERIQVLVVFDQSTTRKGQSSPTTNPAHARLTMVRSEGRWLLEQLCTTESCES